MTTLREAAQQALEALKNLSNCHDGPHDSSGECPSCHERSYMPHAPDCEKQNAITALRAALAQKEQACADICDQHASVEGIAQRCAEQIRARSKT
jgi:RecB family exonuclease